MMPTMGFAGPAQYAAGTYAHRRDAAAMIKAIFFMLKLLKTLIALPSG
jgi:hypothetical protein